MPAVVIQIGSYPENDILMYSKWVSYSNNRSRKGVDMVKGYGDIGCNVNFVERGDLVDFLLLVDAELTGACVD